MGSPLCLWVGGMSFALGATPGPQSRQGSLAQVPAGGSSAPSSLFSLSITNLAMFISEKLAGELWLALGFRLI